ncbi:MAG TPA: hypothetical protein VKB51_00075 [bacterium]|nr:hypothetical protein [bacterium]
MLTDPGRALLARWIYVLVKVDERFIVPYTPQRWAAVTRDPGYGADFAPLLERFLCALTQGDWPPGSYYPGGWYRQLSARGEDPVRVATAPEALERFHLEEVVVDRDGRWLVGDKAIEGRVLQHFLRNLHFDGELARYVIRYRMEQHFETRYLHHRSPPIRVRRVGLDGGVVTLLLNTGREEPLRPETLRMDEAERLYCAVGADDVPAWFEEPARWELLKDADHRDGGWVLTVGGRELSAPLDAPWPYADALPA